MSQSDATYHSSLWYAVAMTTATYQHYLLDSQDYWSRVRNQPEPPAPTYRLVDGEWKLGRFVDPFGAQGLLESVQNRWHHWYVRFLPAAAAGAIIGGVDFIYLFLALPIFIVWYVLKRNNYRKLYDEYFALLQEINETGGPVWSPYNRDRLHRIERSPAAVWP